MKIYWAFIRVLFKWPHLIPELLSLLKGELQNIIEFEKQLKYINMINNERHDVKKQCIYCETEWKEVIKGRIYNKYSICNPCNKRTYHREDLIERLTSKQKGGDT